MSTKISMIDRDAFLQLAREGVNDTAEPQSKEPSIADLIGQINAARALLDKTQRELDAMTLGGPTINRE